MFMNPQTHVDVANPHTRVVMADAFDHFAAKMLEKPIIMDQEDIHMLVDALIDPKAPEERAEVEVAPEPEPVLESWEQALTPAQGLPPAAPGTGPLTPPSSAQFESETFRQIEPQAAPPPPEAKQPKRYWGLTAVQLVVLVFMGLFELGLILVILFILFGDQLVG